MRLFFFFFNDTATTEIYTLSLHDALPIFSRWMRRSTDDLRPGRTSSTSSHPGTARSSFSRRAVPRKPVVPVTKRRLPSDRKSTRLNSSHANISYAVFCLKKKRKHIYHPHS